MLDVTVLSDTCTKAGITPAVGSTSAGLIAGLSIIVPAFCGALAGDGSSADVNISTLGAAGPSRKVSAISGNLADGDS